MQLRSFGRPVQAVALSPDYKRDRTFLSGGLAGNLVLTVGGRKGADTASSTSGGAAATASGWLGSIGLGGSSGTDTVLHSGEGTINTIKWSLSGKYVTWINEQGIKIMRTHLHLESSDSDFQWKRVNHIDRPDLPGWEEMAGVWKGRAEWIDEAALELDEPGDKALEKSTDTNGSGAESSVLKKPKTKRHEKLVIGWGGTIWILNVFPGGRGTGKEAGERLIGRVEVATMLVRSCCRYC